MGLVPIGGGDWVWRCPACWNMQGGTYTIDQVTQEIKRRMT